MFARFLTLLGSLSVVAVLAPAAHAGPLSWTYKAVVQAGTSSATPPASAVLSLGRFPVESSTRAEDQAFYAPLPTGDAGSMAGSGTIVLAASSKGSFQSSEELPTGAVDGFRTLLQITDQASGVRGFTYMNGTGSLVGGPDGDVQLNGDGRVLMLLGNNRYDITWHRQESESVSRIVADVTVSAVTPEPATLALAGLGLGVVAVRRLRRK